MIRNSRNKNSQKTKNEKNDDFYTILLDIIFRDSKVENQIFNSQCEKL